MTGASPRLDRLASVVADGRPVDWEHWEERTDRAARATLRELRALAPAVTDVASHRRSERRLRDGLFLWLSPFVWLAGLKVAMGALGYLFARSFIPVDAVPAWMYAVNMTVFAGVGVLLVRGGWRDHRTRLLGCFFVLVAASFAGRLAAGWTAWLPPALQPWMQALRRLSAEAFLPAFFWMFVAWFPHQAAFTTPQRVARVFLRVSTAVGVVLFCLNLPWAFGGAIAPFGRARPVASAYWAPLLLLMLPAVPVALWKARTAPPDEVRRVSLFAWGIGLGLAPMLLASLLAAFPTPLQAWFLRHRWPVGIVLYGFLLTIPVTTAYAVSVARVLELRLLVRHVFQLLLSRPVLLAAALLPMALFLGIAYERRHQALEALLAPGVARTLLLVSGTAAAGLLLRRPLLQRIGRALLRETPDATAVLARLAEGLRSASDPHPLAEALLRELTRAFRPQSAAVFGLAAGSGRFVPLAGGGRSLPADSALAHVLQQASQPLMIRADRKSSLVWLLPAEEQEWLSDAGCAVIAPLTGSGHGLLGFAMLDERADDRPYAREDHQLLAAVAANAAVALEHVLERQQLQRGGTEADEPASVCRICDKVLEADACSCGGRGEAAALPRLVAGRLRVERRIGTGGMGIVFLATDEELGRRVAVKTLPKVAPDDAARLRREARAMAMVTHPNLAVLYGIESWRGTPLLIVEYLPGGTLADRLRRSRLSRADTLALGVRMARALGRLHGAGVLHRDIKPSNIGYTDDDVPKLLDFGIAQLVEVEAERTGLVTRTARANDWATAGRAGTLLYMPPEALEGAPAGPGLDLWGLALVLYESLAGTHPWRGALGGGIGSPLPDLRELRPDCDAALATFLGRALSFEPASRPPSGKAFEEGLLAVSPPPERHALDVFG